MFGIALTAFSGWVGLAVGDPETVQAAVFIPILPLVFTSSAFAPVEPPARVDAAGGPAANPVTAAIDTARGLALGDQELSRHQPHAPRTAALPLRAVVGRHRRRLHRASRFAATASASATPFPATACSGIKTRFGGFDLTTWRLRTAWVPARRVQVSRKG